MVVNRAAVCLIVTELEQLAPLHRARYKMAKGMTQDDGNDGAGLWTCLCGITLKNGRQQFKP